MCYKTPKLDVKTIKHPNWYLSVFLFGFCNCTKIPIDLGYTVIRYYTTTFEIILISIKKNNYCFNVNELFIYMYVHSTNCLLVRKSWFSFVSRHHPSLLCFWNQKMRILRGWHLATISVRKAGALHAGHLSVNYYNSIIIIKLNFDLYQLLYRHSRAP